MKMVKSLLLGSAAGLVAVAGAQAADLPVKAAPVEYVKVCSLYGVGYYYMPGTDICVKIGGYIRFQTTFGTADQTRPAFAASRDRSVQNAASYGWRTRAVLTMDTRQQTAYGTLRTYFLIGFQNTNSNDQANALYATRGFIQWAGFTFGRATSFFDHFPTAGRAYFAGNFHNSSTGDSGWNVAAYTAQFGNGFSATISLEESRSARNVFLMTGLPTPTGRQTYGANRVYPDVVANLRVDQAWGSAMIGGALHSVAATHYGNGAVMAGFQPAYPGDKVGWALTAATQINLPMMGPGSAFNAQFIYTQGAVQYASQTSAGGGFNYYDGNRVAFGLFTDGIYGNPGSASSSIELTTAWSLALAYEHVWRPGLRTSLYGSYLDVSYNSGATNLICNAIGLVRAAGDTCNPNWQAWNIGSRTEWAPVAGLTLGVDVIYNRIEGSRFADVGTGTVATPAQGIHPAAQRSFGNADSFAGMFRIQRNYHP